MNLRTSSRLHRRDRFLDRRLFAGPGSHSIGASHTRLPGDRDESFPRVCRPRVRSVPRRRSRRAARQGHGQCRRGGIACRRARLHDFCGRDGTVSRFRLADQNACRHRRETFAVIDRATGNKNRRRSQRQSHRDLNPRHDDRLHGERDRQALRTQSRPRHHHRRLRRPASAHGGYADRHSRGRHSDSTERSQGRGPGISTFGFQRRLHGGQPSGRPGYERAPHQRTSGPS